MVLDSSAGLENGEDLRSMGNHSANGQVRKFSAVNIFRIANGKVVEIWNHRDDLGLMQQLEVPIYTGAIARRDLRGPGVKAAQPAHVLLSGLPSRRARKNWGSLCFLRSTRFRGLFGRRGKDADEAFGVWFVRRVAPERDPISYVFPARKHC